MDTSGADTSVKALSFMHVMKLATDIKERSMATKVKNINFYAGMCG